MEGEVLHLHNIEKILVSEAFTAWTVRPVSGVLRINGMRSKAAGSPVTEVNGSDLYHLSTDKQ